MCCISSDRELIIIPHAMLFDIFHSFRSSWYVFNSSAVGWCTVGVVVLVVPVNAGVAVGVTVEAVISSGLLGFTGSGSRVVEAFFQRMMLVK